MSIQEDAVRRMDGRESCANLAAFRHDLVLVPSADETLKEAGKLGGRVLVPGTDIPTVGRFGVFADPQGAVLAAFTPLETAPGGPPKPGDISWHELATSDPAAAFSFYLQGAAFALHSTKP